MNQKTYEKQFDYLERHYPHKNINVWGVGLKFLDAISNHSDVVNLLKTNKIKCRFCKEVINSDDWIIVLHNPPEIEKPINLYFFCLTKKCGVGWGKEKIRKTENERTR